MHRWDTESAYGEQVAFEPAVATELLTEWLRIAGDVVHTAAGTGGTIRFAATDADLDLTAALGERVSSAPSRVGGHRGPDAAGDGVRPVPGQHEPHRHSRTPGRGRHGAARRLAGAGAVLNPRRG